HDDALALLNVAQAGAFLAQVREVRGDALFAKGDQEGARAEYAAALASDSDAQIDRTLLEMKLQDVGGGEPSTADAQAAVQE
ncbi:MAG TPA: tetratricopeptide repeat protein, partial [Steroidobacter sp.]|nr:tetratricopeptide repeat protein [Steroidobacter sp.]